MTKLFITAENVKETTSISGTTDNDSISQKIYYAQISDMVRVLGQDLYDYYLNTETYAGDYLVIFDKYLIDMHVFYAAHYFTLFNEVKSSNVGNTIMSLTNGQPTQKTIQLAEQYKSLAISVENNFRKYMETSTIQEWTSEQQGEETTNFNDFY
jgi:hypothetical protein